MVAQMLNFRVCSNRLDMGRREEGRVRRAGSSSFYLPGGFVAEYL
jgi:hypothetical protein